MAAGHRAYVKETEAKYAEQTRQRVEKTLRRKAKELGYELKAINSSTPATIAEPAVT